MVYKSSLSGFTTSTKGMRYIESRKRIGLYLTALLIGTY